VARRLEIRGQVAAAWTSSELIKLPWAHSALMNADMFQRVDG
jgi:hypothetical protein